MYFIIISTERGPMLDIGLSKKSPQNDRSWAARAIIYIYLYNDDY